MRARSVLETCEWSWRRRGLHPGTRRKFTELYNVQHLTSNTIDPVARVVITSSITVVNAEGETQRESLTVVRDDFWASTSNKQLNFLQHVNTLLKIDGRAAIVVPDNVLFEGGAGETIRRRLLHDCDVHTLLRLPTGVFYAQGRQGECAVLRSQACLGRPADREVWVYDLRTNQHFTLKENPLRYEHLEDFVACYRPEARRDREQTERFRRFTLDELLARDKASLDVFWLRDDSLEDAENLPSPEVLAAESAEDLEAALTEFAQISASLRSSGVVKQ